MDENQKIPTINAHGTLFNLCLGCDGGVGTMPALVALFRAHLLLRGHHEAAPGRGQEVPDHGSHVEEDHGQRCSGPKGDGQVCTCIQ